MILTIGPQMILRYTWCYTRFHRAIQTMSMVMSAEVKASSSLTSWKDFSIWRLNPLKEKLSMEKVYDILINVCYLYTTLAVNEYLILILFYENRTCRCMDGKR